ncbi:MAG: FAD-binding oxidoreductase, partial [Acidobacteriaceae bacterium]|nr:FAD-binding oxidoreductase [Acidobacteriaceae bacterium]
APSLTPGIPVRSRKGHIAVLNAPANFIQHQVLELGYVKSTQAEEDDSVVFNVRQNKNGEVLVGSSRQYGVMDPQIEPAILDRILSRSFEYMPSLKNARHIGSWTGFRAGTPDGLPLIGKCPGSDRVYIATGHEGLGATTSLGTARLLADEILKRSPAIDPKPYQPSRFS